MTARRTPEASLEETFLRAVAGLPEEDPSGRVVAEALGYLQQGFDAHYAGAGASDNDILVGDNAYALSVETIARLDEPRFVAVASRMIRDGAGRIAAGERVTLETWTPHLAGLLDIISGEGAQRSEERIRRAARDLGDGLG
ncbi:MAG: hypothetical protein M3R38_22420 [Actinomycetota bacterium]|nr:hypothetical protein [Actinomycetota bacterium]